MDITLFSHSITNGGAERVMCDLAESLKSKGHNVRILISIRSKESYLKDNAVPVYALDDNFKVQNRYLKIISRILLLFKFIIKNKTDLYVVFLEQPIVLLTLFKPFIKVPIVSSERNDPTSYSPIYQRMLIKASKKVEGSVYQTEFALNFYKKNNANLLNPILIPNAVSSDFIHTREAVKEKVIAAVGRLTKQKNFPLLINAFAKIVNNYPEYRLYIYGRGELLNNFIKLIKDLGIEDKVVFPGYISNLSEELAKAQMFVLSSDYEGMPNALIEAMALGLPCIATDCGGGGARFLIKNMENGILIPTNDCDAMVKAMDALLSDAELSKRLSSAAKKISVKLSQDVIYNKWNQYLVDIVNNYKLRHKL